MRAWRMGFLAISLLFSTSSWAYYAVLDNGEILKSGSYKLTGDLQFLTKNGGANFGTRFDLGWGEDYGLRAILGFGKTDFFTGGEFRWMPVPDVDNQPAMGVNFAVLYGKDGGIRDLTFRVEPMLSKRIEINTAVWTPYAALPIGTRIRNADDKQVDEDTVATFQLALGSQLQVEQWKNLQFMFEIGLDLDNSPGYVSVAGVFYFDKENGMVME